MYRYITITLFVISLSACSNESTNTNKTEEAVSLSESDNIIRITKTQFVQSGYVLGKPVQVDFEETIAVAGEIHVPEKNRAQVSTYIDGKVSSIELIEGQWVKEGQTLFTITNPELITIQENYLLASEELKYKMSEKKRLEQLLAEKLTTKNELTKVHFEINNLNTKIAALSNRIQLLGLNTDNISNRSFSPTVSIQAPMSGYVSNIFARKGMHLETAQSAMDITNTGHKHLELQILEKNIASISKGQKINFFLQDNPMKTYEAKVYLINKMVNDDHIVRVHCHISEDAAKSLITGMYVSAKIVLQKSNLSALPKEAIVQMEGKSFALRLKNLSNGEYVFEKVVLQTGKTNEAYIELNNNVSMDDQYLTKGAYFMIM